VEDDGDVVGQGGGGVILWGIGRGGGWLGRCCGSHVGGMTNGTWLGCLGKLSEVGEFMAMLGKAIHDRGEGWDCSAELISGSDPYAPLVCGERLAKGGHSGDRGGCYLADGDASHCGA
jgi:hypothetical protein